MIAPTADRVERQTDPQINQLIQEQTESRVLWHAANPDRIGQRLAELDQEWDIERMLQANAAGLSLLGLLMTLRRGRHWVLLPLVVQSFMVQHTLQGWCPPLPLFRRLGFRTAAEIAQERRALCVHRGLYRMMGEAGGQDPNAEASAAKQGAGKTRPAGNDASDAGSTPNPRSSTPPKSRSSSGKASGRHSNG